MVVTQCCDNVAVMSGSYNGLQVKTLQLIGIQEINIHDNAQALSLVIRDAMQGKDMAANLL